MGVEKKRAIRQYRYHCSQCGGHFTLHRYFCFSIPAKKYSCPKCSNIAIKTGVTVIKDPIIFGLGAMGHRLDGWALEREPQNETP